MQNAHFCFLITALKHQGLAFWIGIEDRPTKVTQMKLVGIYVCNLTAMLIYNKNKRGPIKRPQYPKTNGNSSRSRSRGAGRVISDGIGVGKIWRSFSELHAIWYQFFSYSPPIARWDFLNYLLHILVINIFYMNLLPGVRKKSYWKSAAKLVSGTRKNSCRCVQLCGVTFENEVYRNWHKVQFLRFCSENRVVRVRSYICRCAGSSYMLPINTYLQFRFPCCLRTRLTFICLNYKRGSFSGKNSRWAVKLTSQPQPRAWFLKEQSPPGAATQPL